MLYIIIALPENESGELTGQCSTHKLAASGGPEKALNQWLATRVDQAYYIGRRILVSDGFYTSCFKIESQPVTVKGVPA